MKYGTIYRGAVMTGWHWTLRSLNFGLKNGKKSTIQFQSDRINQIEYRMMFLIKHVYMEHSDTWTLNTIQKLADDGSERYYYWQWNFTEIFRLVFRFDIFEAFDILEMHRVLSMRTIYHINLKYDNLTHALQPASNGKSNLFFENKKIRRNKMRIVHHVQTFKRSMLNSWFSNIQYFYTCKFNVHMHCACTHRCDHEQFF